MHGPGLFPRRSLPDRFSPPPHQQHQHLMQQQYYANLQQQQGLGLPPFSPSSGGGGMGGGGGGGGVGPVTSPRSRHQQSPSCSDWLAMSQVSPQCSTLFTLISKKQARNNV